MRARGRAKALAKSKAFETWERRRRSTAQYGGPGELPRAGSSGAVKRANPNGLIHGRYAHPVQAAELPSWNVDVLRSVLEGIS